MTAPIVAVTIEPTSRAPSIGLVPNSTPARKPPTRAPTTPSTMWPMTPRLSSPLTRKPARYPAMAPSTIQAMMLTFEPPSLRVLGGPTGPAVTVAGRGAGHDNVTGRSRCNRLTGGVAAPISLSDANHELQRAIAPEDLGAGGVAAPAVEQEGDGALADLQLVHGHLAEPGRKVGTIELEHVTRRVRVHPEHRLQERERGGRGPGLGGAGNRVGDGHVRKPAIEAAEELGEPEVGRVLGRLEDARRDAVRGVVAACALHPRRDQRVVVRPDGPGVVAHGVVARLARGVGPDAPAAVHRGIQEPVDDLVDVVARDDPAPQAMTRVGADRLHLALVAVQGHGIEADLGHPEGRLEAALELGRFGLQALRELVLAEAIGERRQAPLRVEDVALDLDERDRRERQAAICVTDGVTRVLPALVQEPPGVRRSYS